MVVSTAVLGVLVVVAVAATGAVGVVAAHRTAQAAADLSALAGAGALQDGRSACGRASVIARRNGASLRRCQVSGWEVAVVVVDTARLPGGALDLSARSRAGPVLSAPGP